MDVHMHICFHTQIACVQHRRKTTKRRHLFWTSALESQSLVGCSYCLWASGKNSHHDRQVWYRKGADLRVARETEPPRGGQEPRTKWSLYELLSHPAASFSLLVPAAWHPLSWEPVPHWLVNFVNLTKARVIWGTGSTEEMPLPDRPMCKFARILLDEWLIWEAH